MLDQNQIAQLKSEIVSGLRSELQGTLQASANDIQLVIDRMGADWQQKFSGAIQAQLEQVKDARKAAIATSAFLGLFQEHSAEFLAKVDDKTTSTVELQRSLYKACDGAVDAVPGVGPKAKFHHNTRFEVVGGLALAAVGGIGLRAMAQAVIVRVKARRAARAAAAETAYQG